VAGRSLAQAAPRERDVEPAFLAQETAFSLGVRSRHRVDVDVALAALEGVDAADVDV
jgi:hypothetical protein